MSGVPAHRRAVGRLRRLLVPSACLIVVASCGERLPPAVRSVVPLVRDELPALGTLRPELDRALDVALEPGMRHVTGLQLDAGRQYTVELQFRGARPVLRDLLLAEGASPADSSDALIRTTLLPGDPLPGVVRGILRPTTERLRLEISAVGAQTQLDHLLVRRWGSAAGMTGHRATGWHALGIYGDYRVASVLRPLEVLHWAAVVPPGATALRFDVVSDPTLPSEAPPVQGVHLLLTVTPAPGLAAGNGARSEGPTHEGMRVTESREGHFEGHANQTVRIPVPASRTAWQPVALGAHQPGHHAPGSPGALRLPTRHLAEPGCAGGVVGGVRSGAEHGALHAAGARHDALRAVPHDARRRASRTRPGPIANAAARRTAAGCRLRQPRFHRGRLHGRRLRLRAWLRRLQQQRSSGTHRGAEGQRHRGF